MLALGLCSANLTATIPERSADQYSQIPERNAFGLKPPQQIKETAPPPQLPKIVLTGITTILGNKRVLMKTQPTPGKPGEQNKEVSLILTEGQREGDIEVLQIDEKTGSVKVNNSGTVMTLTFERDGAKLPSTPAPPPAPVGIVPGTAATLVTNRAVLAPALSNAPGMHPLPTRNYRLPATQPVPAPASGQAAAAVQPPVGGIPTATGLVPTPAPAPAVVAQPSDLTPEEQAILQQIQREAATPMTPVVSNVPVPGTAVAPMLPQ